MDINKDLAPLFLYADKFDKLAPNHTQLRLYGHPCCAFTERIRLALALQKLPYQYVVIDFQTRADWFKKLGSEGKVPILELKDSSHYLYESMPIINYLEEQGENYILPKNLIDKTYVRILGSIIMGITSDFYPVLKTFGANKESIKNLKVLFGKLEAKLCENKKGQFFLDYDAPTLADLLLLPHFKRAVMFEGTECDEVYKELKFNEYPKLMAWMVDMENYGDIKNHIVSKEEWAKFIKYYKATTKFEFRYPWP